MKGDYEAGGNTSYADEFKPDPSAIYIKLGGILMLFVLPFLCGIIPSKTGKLRNSARYSSIANCFGGGVFFGTCFLHLIPEVKLELMEYSRLSQSKALEIVPLAEILECVGFILMILGEAIIDTVTGGHGHSHGFEDLDEEPKEEVGMHDLSEDKGEIKVAEPHTKGVAVMILALAIHSVFEGLAIGVEHQPSVFMQLAGAIVIHKCVVAFALGNRIVENRTGLKVLLILMTVFCVCTPLGVGIAMGIMNQIAKTETITILLSSGIVQGLSTGFFLYITFAEMLFSEMQNKKDMVLKVVFMSIGVTIIAISTILHNYMEN